ncbi:MAG: putative butanol dehydrogenase, nadph-dependent [Proteobacteria bacterium]|nr:putative butanol dehydrogenase, nadph-dependent [Pseudomonadota bacterium]
MVSKRVFVVTGGQSMFANGTIAKIEAIFRARDIEVLVHSGVPANPPVSAVSDGIKAMRQFAPDTVIGVGGGAAMDAAKLMALFYEHADLDIETAFRTGLPQERQKIQLICIPGTSGTASEVTPFAVLTFAADQLKIGARAPSLVADLAILDAEITLSMPSHVAAETGVDALTHAIECFTNPAVEEFASCLAAGAVEGLFAHLESSVLNGDIDSREKVHHFQCMAGCAFSNAGTGLDHGVAHAFGGRFGLGHGLLNAVALPHVIRFNSRDPWARQRYDYLARRIGASDLATAVFSLTQSLGIPGSFAAIGVPQEAFEQDFEMLVENSLKGSTRVNPAPVSADDMRVFLRNVFSGTGLA